MGQKVLSMRHMSNSSGFTIPEILVVTIVTGILLSLLFGPLDSLYTANNSGLKSITQISDLKTALNIMRKDISMAVEFRATNDVADAFGPDNNPLTSDTWRWKGSSSVTETGRVLITRNYATTGTADDPSRMLVLNNIDCSTPLMNNVVYFVKDGSLYRRTLKNTSTPCSGTIAQKTTCATGSTGSGCEGTDAKLLTNVTLFKIDYYENPNSTSTVAVDQYADASAPLIAQARTVNIFVTLGNNNSSSIRISRLNGDTI